MFRMLLLLLVAVALTTAGCKSNKGAREYVPGKGWTPVNRAPAP